MNLLRKKIRQRLKEEKEAEKTRRKRWGVPMSDGRKRAKKKAKKKRATVPVWFVSGGLPGLGQR
jgi:DNA invertase Pin-like site-specific DNA recombinase